MEMDKEQLGFILEYLGDLEWANGSDSLAREIWEIGKKVKDGNQDSYTKEEIKGILQEFHGKLGDRIQELYKEAL